MTRAQEIVQETLSASNGDIRAAISALENGQYLANFGYEDSDQNVIEEAHSILKSM